MGGGFVGNGAVGERVGAGVGSGPRVGMAVGGGTPSVGGGGTVGGPPGTVVGSLKGGKGTGINIDMDMLIKVSGGNVS